MAAGPLSSPISASFEVILHCNTHPPEPPTSILLLSAQTADQSVQNSPQTASIITSITTTKAHYTDSERYADLPILAKHKSTCRSRWKESFLAVMTLSAPLAQQQNPPTSQALSPSPATAASAAPTKMKLELQQQSSTQLSLHVATASRSMEPLTSCPNKCLTDTDHYLKAQRNQWQTGFVTKSSDTTDAILATYRMQQCVRQQLTDIRHQLQAMQTVQEGTPTPQALSFSNPANDANNLVTTALPAPTASSMAVIPPPSPSCQAPSSTHHKWFRSFLILSPPPAHKPLITKPKHADIKPSLIQILAASPDTTASSTAQIAPKLPPSSPRSLRYSSLSHRYYFHRGRPPDDSTIRTS